MGVTISATVCIPILDSQRKDTENGIRKAFWIHRWNALDVIEFLDRNFTEKKKSDDVVIENFSCKDRSIFIIESESSRTIKTNKPFNQGAGK